MPKPDVASPSLWRNPAWLKLWFGQTVSLVGDFVFNTTIVLWIGSVIAAGQPWAPAAVSGVLVAAAVPVLIIGPVAGVYVDRWDRRRIMLTTDLLRAGFVAVLFLVPAFGSSWPVEVRLILIYAMVALISSASQFFNPSRFTLIASVVPADQQPRAFGLSTATQGIAAVVGPPLAAPVLFGSGIQWALAINMASFLLSYIAVLLLRVPAGAETRRRAGFWASLREGLRFFRGSRMLVVMAAAICIYQFGVGAITVLGQFFVVENLHRDAGWLGVLNAASAGGSILGALIAARIAKWIGDVHMFTYGIVATGLGVLIFSRSTTLEVAVVLMLLAGMVFAGVNVVTGPLVIRATPQEMLGRINAVVNPMIYLASILAMAITGFLASTTLDDFHRTVAGVEFGRVDAIFGVAAVFMTAAGLIATFLLRSKAAPERLPTAPVPETTVSEVAS